jgi:hypothetical protein
MGKPLSDMRPARLLALVLLLVALAAVGVLIARKSLWLLLVYGPIALFLLVLMDPALIQRIFPLRRTRAEVVQLLQTIVDGTAMSYDWQSFLMLRIEDPQLDALSRVRLLAQMPGNVAPPAHIVRECLDELTKSAASPANEADGVWRPHL